MLEKNCDRCDIDISNLTNDEYFACSLCKSCIKLRPVCKYCKESVNEINEEDQTKKEFENNHWMCIQNHRKETLDLGWRKYADIDWDLFRSWVRNKYKKLFHEIEKKDYKKSEVNLIVVTGINGGLSFNVQEIVSKSQVTTLTDMVENWYDIHDQISETFAQLDVELTLEDEQSEKDYDRILLEIKEIIVNEFLQYKSNNFNFDKKIKVNWELYES